MIEILLAAVETDEDREKVLLIYNKYYSLMAYLISNIVGNSEDVADLAQDCILRIIDNLDIIDMSDENKLKGLFSAIARNRAIDFLKNKNNQNLEFNEEMYIDSQEENVDDIVIRQDTYERIKTLIESMSETYRDVCRLKYVFEYLEREIALILNLSPKVVNQRIFRGRREIREMIRKEKLL